MAPSKRFRAENNDQSIGNPANDTQKLKQVVESAPISPKTIVESIAAADEAEPIDNGKNKPKPSPLEMLKTNYKLIVSSVMKDSLSSVNTLAQTLNQITGYSKIEEHKQLVQQLEKEVKEARLELKRAKNAYSDAIEQRSNLQREVTELLTRKDTWNPMDVERFTQLYRSDHENQRNESDSKIRLETAEQVFDSAQLKLGTKILARYHEEQLWSDKIRLALTYGTWMLTGLNIIFFVVAIFFVEPWKRRRLVNAFHVEVSLQFDEYNTEIRHLSDQMKQLTDAKQLSEAFFELEENLGPQVQRLSQRTITSALTSWDSLRAFFHKVFAMDFLSGQFLITKSDLIFASAALVVFSSGLTTIMSRMMFS